MITYIAIIIVILILVCIIAWWIIGVYNVEYPGPARPDGDYVDMIEEFESLPKDLWFRNNPCIFDDWLACRNARFIVYESNGVVVYDSVNRRKWKGWAHRDGYCNDNTWSRNKKWESSSSSSDTYESSKDIWRNISRRKIGYENAEQLTSSVEYIRACVLTQGIVSRGKLNNICEMVKNGDFYRIVHVSQYIYDDTDPEF